MGTLTSYILDTCTLIWLCTDPKRISETAREAIETTQAPLLLSDVSAIELALKWQSGKLASRSSAALAGKTNSRLGINVSVVESV